VYAIPNNRQDINKFISIEKWLEVSENILLVILQGVCVTQIFVFLGKVTVSSFRCK
jgi:hypothetical protein